MLFDAAAFEDVTEIAIGEIVHALIVCLDKKEAAQAQAILWQGRKKAACFA